MADEDLNTLSHNGAKCDVTKDDWSGQFGHGMPWHILGKMWRLAQLMFMLCFCRAPYLVGLMALMGEATPFGGGFVPVSAQ